MGENNMQKPLSVARYEFIQQLTNLINGANIPFFVIEAVLKDMYIDVKSLAQKQLESDIGRYRAALESVHQSSDDSISGTSPSAASGMPC